MKRAGVVILGAGMAGVGASRYLNENGIKPVLFEARPSPGGHTSTHLYDDGFVFDEGPHISFTSNPRIQNLFSSSVGGKYERMRAYVNNYWKGHWIKHPAQVNLHGLPAKLVVDCIRDFVEATHSPQQEIRNYEDWLNAAFGKTFASTFPLEYTKKYHTTDARNLTTDWLGPRLYRPKLEEVLIGALEDEPLDVHYVDSFRYPANGGFVSYLNAFLPMAELRCNHRVIAIDAKEKLINFENGTQAEYSSLISSIPLPELIPMVKGVPKDVLAAAELLSCTEVVLVNIGLSRPVETRAQWTYFYDSNICFARLSFPAGFSPTLVPKACGSIQAENYFSKKWKPFACQYEDLIESTIEGLLQCGLVTKRSEIIHKSIIHAPFANIIFDHDRPRSLDVVHGYLDEIGIAYCGRYGDWGYIWTDQAFISGERAASMVLRKS
jgi:protoporphyrinogen oxidase